MVVSEKIYLEACIKNQYISLKDNTAQLYFISGRTGLCLYFSSAPDGSDIHRFSNRKWTLTKCTLRNQ